MRVYDYHCPHCGAIEERFVHEDAVNEQMCFKHQPPVIMNRRIPAPRAALEPFTGAFPGAADAWVRNREKRMAEERKHERNHGTTWIGQSEGYVPKNPD